MKKNVAHKNIFLDELVRRMLMTMCTHSCTHLLLDKLQACT